MKKYAAEFIGTAVLTLFGCGSAAISGGVTGVLGVFGIAAAFGLSIVAMAYVIGDVSGCHINPAVSLGVFLNGGMQKKQEAQKEQIEAMKQTTTMLIIDKKRVRLNQSGLPQIVIDQTPKLMRRSKLPIVKAKIGPKIMSRAAARTARFLSSVGI